MTAGELPMLRKFGVLALLVCAAVGCRMCDSPYDYCGPVVPNQPHPQTCPTCGNSGYSGDYAASRGSNGQQSVIANSQAAGSQNSSVSSNNNNTMR